MNTVFAKDARASSPKMAAAYLRKTFCAQKAGVGASLAHFLQPFAHFLRPLRAKSSKDKVAENGGYIKKTLSLSIFNQPFALPPHARIFGPMRERGAQKAQKVSNRCAHPSTGQEIPMQQPACFDCRFFTTATWDKADDLAEADFDDCIQGHCRISPPRVGRFRGEGQTLKYDYGQWPLVLSGDWCGAFSPCQRALRDVADRSRHVAHAAHLGQLGQDGRTPAHTSRHVGPRSTISVEAEQGRDHAPVRGHVAEHQARQDG